MKRIPPLLLAFGFACFFMGATLFSLSANTSSNIAYAALPDGHPTLPGWHNEFAPTARVSTTVRDFFLPGTQPHQMIDELQAPLNCTYCHDGYSSLTGQDQETETWFAWSGSMMAQSGRDPLFWAALDVANADADGAGEFCLRCHMPRGWLEGRSASPDGSDMTFDDLEGVQCIVCHRMVDAEYSAENPERDLDVLAAITTPVTVTAPTIILGSGTMIVDPLDHRRGPLVITEVQQIDPHPTFNGAETTLTSPYHQDSAFCGACHDISNPVYTWNPVTEQYELNPLDTPGDLNTGFPVERTYSEWYLSEYNTPQGVYAPEFGGNQDYVSSCQDCHMRQVTGVGGLVFGSPGLGGNRDDFRFHDMTGGNTWVPQIIPSHPTFSATFNADTRRVDALNAGVERARYMLQNAATLNVTQIGNQLIVTVINETGHKLPTGYPEGRRMWLQVEGYDANGDLVYVSGAYDNETAVLTHDADLKIYEVQQGFTSELAAILGLDEGASFHFALNNVTVSDNRIPPRGYTFDAYAAVGAAPASNSQPDPTLYADGQYWDTTVYTLPAGVTAGSVRLLYQTTSKEYVEFLRDNNPYPDYNNGQILYDLWEEFGKNEPEIMAQAGFGYQVYLPIVQRP
ncbi:MAG: hypothetical protein KC443_12460 [Anaerolineales bacterium]|nr:hypothetical protein [Anaerolineales bacterium]